MQSWTAIGGLTATSRTPTNNINQTGGIPPPVTIFRNMEQYVVTMVAATTPNSPIEYVFKGETIIGVFSTKQKAYKAMNGLISKFSSRWGEMYRSESRMDGVRIVEVKPRSEHSPKIVKIFMVTTIPGLDIDITIK